MFQVLSELNKSKKFCKLMALVTTIQASVHYCAANFLQLEASIKNGDIHGFQSFSEAAKFLPSLTKKKDVSLREHQEPSKEVPINGSSC
jgi:hypothetical protein